MWLVQEGGMYNGICAGKCAADKGPVGDRPNEIGAGVRPGVDPNDITPISSQHPGQALAQMPSAAGHHDSHSAVLITSTLG